MNRSAEDLDEHPLRNSFLLVWGLSYWFAAVLRPGLVASLSPTLSALSMALLGAVILGNLLLDSRVVWILLGARATFGMVASWLTVTYWAVPYAGTGIAAVSMAGADAVAAVLFFSKAVADA